WHHIKEFYAEVGGAAPLWIIIVNQAMTAYFDVGEAADLLMNGASGAIRVLAAAYTPPAGAVTVATGLPAAVITAIGEAKTFVARQFTAHKPVRVMLEGYAITSPAGLTYDLRAIAGPNAYAVMVVVGRTSGTVSDDFDPALVRHASVGTVLGRAARIPVHHNLARVRTGPINGVVSAEFSDGTSLADATDAELVALNTLGYVFFRVIPSLSGVFINDDHMATVINSDYSALLRGRVIDKAARIAYTTYVQELNNDVELDAATGFMALAVVKNLESVIETAIGTQMAGEITSVDAFIEPAQNILATDLLEVQLNIVPRGVAKNIKVTLAYANPAAAA
ncbi:MAG: DUF2586 family protein, partial [Flavobacteriales bacterium]